MLLLPLDQMSRAEKLQAMETLWADLTRDEAAFESPAWHENVLKHTEGLVREGKTDFVDWDNAKKDLRRRLK
jgi:hypothetical protein